MVAREKRFQLVEESVSFGVGFGGTPFLRALMILVNVLEFLPALLGAPIIPHRTHFPANKMTSIFETEKETVNNNNNNNARGA